MSNGICNNSRIELDLHFIHGFHGMSHRLANIFICNEFCQLSSDKSFTVRNDKIQVLYSLTVSMYASIDID